MKLPPVEYSGLLEDVAEVDVCVQEVRVEGDGLLKVVDGQPDLPLGVEDAAQVGPGHREVGPSFYGFEIARLVEDRSKDGERKGKKKNTISFCSWREY